MDIRRTPRHRPAGRSALLRGALGAVAAMTAVTACQAGTGTAGHEPSLGRIPRPAALADIVTPLDAYIGTGPQRQAEARAEDLLVRVCMRHLGLDWPTEPTREVRMTLQAWDLGFLDPRTVPRYGYHPPGLEADLSVSVGGPAGGARVVSGVSKAAYAGTPDPALAGKPVPPGGCSARAQRELDRGAPAADAGFAIDSADSAGQRALTDSRVVAVTSQWSTCMRGKGLRYRSPYDARDDPRWSLADGDPAPPATDSGPPGGSAELRTAAADLACRQKVNYLGVRLAVISAYEHRAIDAHRSEFARVKVRHDQRTRNTASVLATARTGP